MYPHQWDMRLTHIPTGIVVHACRYDRSMHRTKLMLMKVLRSKIYWMEQKPDLTHEVRLYEDNDLLLGESEKILIEANLKRVREIK
jgi:protein subunit release factor A